MSEHDTRETSLRALSASTSNWDVIVVGGGITGAGILLEATRCGLKSLLVEQRDFAWGTSSRSSKLVHGGLRYLKEGQIALTLESVRERQQLMREAPGLVQSQSFAFADYTGKKPGRWMFQLGLHLYDLMAGQRGIRHYLKAHDFLMRTPHIGLDGLQGGMHYMDAKTDDARLVLRVLQEARTLGATTVNYMPALKLLRDSQATEGSSSAAVSGVLLQDAMTGNQYSVHARLVINATGAWADALRQQQGSATRIRPLRGSHLVLPAWRLPVAQAVSLMHPIDGRPVFAFPWEGVTLVGTTDIDHHGGLQIEPRITQAEALYLMAALQYQFPQRRLSLEDVIASFAGVRPVIDTGKSDPSREARDHAVWMEQGLLTVTGGKLTTFRRIAQDAVQHALPLFPHGRPARRDAPVFAPAAELPRTTLLNSQVRQRLQGHYGQRALEVVGLAQRGELATIPGTQTLWVELRWAARHEAVLHLEDLLLRRTRLGILLRRGGADHMQRIRMICQDELKWSNARWQEEEAHYCALWQSHYSPPEVKSSAEGPPHV